MLKMDRKMKTPGARASHGAVVSVVWEVRSMLPQDGVGQLDAQTEERQRRLGEHRATHAQRRRHDDRTNRVGQDVAPHEALRRGANGTRGDHVFPLAVLRWRPG
jgi:hypothetical protein